MSLVQNHSKTEHNCRFLELPTYAITRGTSNNSIFLWLILLKLSNYQKLIQRPFNWSRHYTNIPDKIYHQMYTCYPFTQVCNTKCKRAAHKSYTKSKQTRITIRLLTNFNTTCTVKSTWKSNIILNGHINKK